MPAATTPSADLADTADQLAANWLHDPAQPPPTLGAAAAAALARALHARGYAAIYADLNVTAAAAGCCRALAHSRRAASATEPGAQTAPTGEIDALALWLEGVVRANRGEAAAAVELLDAAYRAFQTVGGLRDAAATQVPKLMALSLLGRHDEALQCGQRALAQLLQAGDERSAGKVEINLGGLLIHRARYAEAAQHYRHAAVRFARVSDRQHSVMADLCLAMALTWQYQFDEAARIYDRAAARVQAHGLASLQGQIDSNRGLLDMHRGRHAAALRWLERALREFEQHGPPQRLAQARIDLADAYLAANLLPEALALYDAARATAGDVNAPLEAAWAGAQHALALSRQGWHDEARQELEAVRELFHRRGHAVGVARVDLHAADLALRSGQPEQALRLAESTRGVLAASGVRGWLAEALVLVAEAQAALGRADAARAAFDSAAEHALALPELEARCLSGRGALLLTAGDADAARVCFEAACDRVEQQQASLPGDEFRTAYGSDKQEAYEALIGLALAPGGGRRADPAQVLADMERARGRALRAGHRRADDEMPGAADWRENAHWLQQQWQAASAGGNVARAEELRVALTALEQQWLEAHRRHQAARRVGDRPTPSLHLGTLAALQAALPADTAWVQYAGTGSALHALVVRAGAQAQVVACGSPDLADRVGQLRFQIDALRHGQRLESRHGAQLAARAQAHLRALYDSVWAPVAPWVGDATRVLVLPHRHLHYLPFAALHDGRQSLLDRHAIGLATSATHWLAGRAGAARDNALPRWDRVLALGVSTETLPHVASEIEAVASAFGDEARVLLDRAATWPALRARLAGVDALHLACHGQFRADSPYFSALQLSDGTLTLRDAATLPLHGVSVALSACETGLSRVAPGDEFIGLVRGFLLAGAPRVLATLWTVEDSSTAELMRDYYPALRAGVPPVEALRRAQRALRERWPHPYHWAPFVLHEHGR